MIVLHYTAMSSSAGAVDWLCNGEAQVSAHYVICKTGCVTQLVDEADRAWHAGAGRWGDIEDVNSRSIGIELDNDGASPFSQPLMAALETLLPRIMQRWNIPPHRVIGHSDMAPGRKIDPGPRFDWRRLALLNLAVWPHKGSQIAIDPARFAKLLSAFGYQADMDDDLRLNVFRTRFRPQATGPLSEHDMAIAADLAERFPIDQTPVTS